MKSMLLAAGLALVVTAACSAGPPRDTPPQSAPASATPGGGDAPWPSIPIGPPVTLLPDGVYVHTANRDGLITAGATGVDVENAGRWTLTVNGTDGSLVLQHDDNHPDETKPAHFTLMGDRVRVQLADEFFDVQWRDNGTSVDLTIVAADTRFGSHSNDAVAHRLLNAILGGAWMKEA